MNPLGTGIGAALPFYMGPRAPAAHSLLAGQHISKRFRLTVAITTLRTLPGDRFDGKELLIKIDVEGAEYGVLRGAERTLTMLPHPTWIVEI